MKHAYRRGMLAAVAVATTVGTSLALSAPALASSNKGKSNSSSSGSSAATKGEVENPGTATVTETGSTLLYPLWNIWAPAYNQKFPKVTITTAGTGSGTGISDAAAGTVDIGSSDAYLSPSETQASPHLKNIPLAISAQFIAYNLPGVTAHVKLNGAVLAAMYKGQITHWNDPQIAALNKGVTLPNIPVVTLHRSDGSGDTFLFTQYLTKSAGNAWAAIGYNTTVSWPNAPGALGENGNSGMVTGCKATPGCVAYIGVSYLTQSLQAGLGEAEAQNASHNYELPTASAINAEASSFVSKTPANGTISLIYGPAKDGYPIINYEYAIVDSQQSSSSTATAIRSLLEWAINPKDGNSSQYLSQVNFQPLPSGVVSQSQKQIAQIK